MGLKKYGKGDWRNISRNFVMTRTPTQVASHAQKYFIRQVTGGKDKRRSSIHDITTVNIPDNTSSSSPDHSKPLSPNNSSAVIQLQQQPKQVFDFELELQNEGSIFTCSPIELLFTTNLLFKLQDGRERYEMSSILENKNFTLWLWSLQRKKNTSNEQQA